MESVVRWVECSRCEKWRIIHPLPDGSDEVIPDIWFCEMNRDGLHNTCEALEEEYKAPEAPLFVVPVLPPNMNRIARPAKSNDPDSIRAKLKLLTNDDLQAAYESIDLERLFKDEFEEHLETARSPEFFKDIPKAQTASRGRPAVGGKKEVDIDGLVNELRRLTSKGVSIFPHEISSSQTNHLR